MNGLEAEAKPTGGRRRRGLSGRFTGLAAQIHEHHEVEVLVPLTLPSGWERRASGVVDRAPPVHDVHSGQSVMFVDVDAETAGGRRQRPTLDLGGLRKRIVGVLRDLQQYAVRSVSVAPHQRVDALPQEFLMPRLLDEGRQAVQRFSLELERIHRGCPLSLSLCPLGFPESVLELFALLHAELLKRQRQMRLDGREHGTKVRLGPFAPARPPGIHLLAVQLEVPACPSLDGAAEQPNEVGAGAALRLDVAKSDFPKLAERCERRRGRQARIRNGVDGEQRLVVDIGLHHHC